MVVVAAGHDVGDLHVHGHARLHVGLDLLNDVRPGLGKLLAFLFLAAGFFACRFSSSCSSSIWPRRTACSISALMPTATTICHPPLLLAARLREPGWRAARRVWGGLRLARPAQPAELVGRPDLLVLLRVVDQRPDDDGDLRLGELGWILVHDGAGDLGGQRRQVAFGDEGAGLAGVAVAEVGQAEAAQASSDCCVAMAALSSGAGFVPLVPVAVPLVPLFGGAVGGGDWWVTCVGSVLPAEAAPALPSWRRQSAWRPARGRPECSVGRYCVLRCRLLRCG